MISLLVSGRLKIKILVKLHRLPTAIPRKPRSRKKE
jgi:hypothetical protein